ncbi:MAG TPA: hypothetical protein VG309_07770, partial [Rhizomicrobium sp.]|nr:hypothetical protein [Rhizomicrobium sp.]
NDPNTTKIYGVEAQVQAVFGALSFDFGAGLMHSSLGQFYAVDSRFTQVDACNPKSGPAEAPPVGYCQNVGGNPQTYAPNFTFNVGAQYAFDLGNENTLTPRVNYGHVSDQWASVFDNAAMGDRLGERNILGAQLAWNSGTWTATLYGSNLTNEHYIAAVNSGIRWAGLPRQFGINVVKTF